MAKKQALSVKKEIVASIFGGQIPLGFTVDSAIFEKVADVFRKHGKFMPREEIENDETVLQAIVYGIVTDGKKVLGLWRKERQNSEGNFKETRLNNKIGLAAGGHIEPLGDIADVNFFEKEIIREFSEELAFSENPTPIPAGIIMYDETPIDRVHIGLIYKVHVKAGEVGLAQNNDEYEKCEFLSPEYLVQVLDHMEGWGKAITKEIVSGAFNLT